MNVLLTEYTDLLAELEHMKWSCQLFTAMTSRGNVVIPSFEHVMRVEHIQYRMDELYTMMQEMGCQLTQERVNHCTLRFFVYSKY